MEALSRKYHSEDIHLADTLHDLGVEHFNVGNHHKARDLLERSLTIAEKHVGPDHIAHADVLTSLGYTYGNLGNLPKARDLIERALKINEKPEGNNNLGQICNCTGCRSKTSFRLQYVNHS